MPAVKAASAKRRSNRRDSDSTQDSRLILPAFRPFQLATLQRKVPKGETWLYEMKFDGYRMQAAIAGDQCGATPATGTTGPGSSVMWCRRSRGSRRARHSSTASSAPWMSTAAPISLF